MTGALERPTRAPGLHSELIDGEELVVDEARHVLVHLNRTGTLIWRLCDGSRTAEEIVELLRAAYPDAGDQVEQDTRALLAELAAAGVLVDAS